MDDALLEGPTARHAWHIPARARPYKRTREFDEHDMPAGLRSAHDTKAGVWGELVVLAGTLRFFDLAQPEAEPLRLGVGRHGVIAPQALHRVEPEPGTRFFVVFHRVDPP
jgi:tellurite resistance-related uncharacterized protein